MEIGKATSSINMEVWVIIVSNRNDWLDPVREVVGFFMTPEDAERHVEKVWGAFHPRDGNVFIMQVNAPIKENN